MLTESERRWLHQRRHWNCIYCPAIPRSMCLMGERPAHCAIADTDWKDAAEFEGRVAARLATDRGWWTPCIETHKCEETVHFPSKFGIENWGKCDWCKLKWARLLVEEEMDGK